MQSVEFTISASILLFLVTIFSSCSGENRKPLNPSDSKLIDLQADLLVLREENNLIGIDSASYSQRTDSLHRAYGMTTVFFDSLLEDYRQDLEIWREFNMKVGKRLEFLQQSENAKRKK